MQPTHNILITKSTGELEPFDPTKLVTSLKHAGAKDEVANRISEHVQRELRQSMTTDEIYSHAFELLRASSRRAAAKYSMKRAISELGPEGYPFERLLAEIWKAKGYEAMTGQVVQGACVEHEVDLVAWKGEELIMAEAKFHNEPGIKSDLKVALYVKARFDDLKGETYEYGGKKRSITEWYLVTNTKFSDHALRYAKCQGLSLIGWNYPTHGNLEDLIHDAHLHPLTCLASLSMSEKRALLGAGLILCKDVAANKMRLLELGVDPSKVTAVLDDVRHICI
ncbi:MAG: ATP cone domain-containing protein [bacterium]|nr:ATP cone domain-containing protein [bacterium]